MTSIAIMVAQQGSGCAEIRMDWVLWIAAEAWEVLG